MAVVKNWDYRNKYFEIKSGGQSELSAGASYEGFGFRKAKDFFGVYKKGDRLILHVNGEEFDVDLASCGVSYSHNPLFERVKITSSQKTVFKKTYWLLGKLGHSASDAHGVVDEAP